MRKRFVMVGLVVGACTNSIPSSNGVDGSVAGNVLAVSDATWSIVPLTGGGRGVAIEMSSTPGICADLGAQVRHPGQQLIDITLDEIGDTMITAPTAPDSFVIATHGHHLAFWTVVIYDAACKPTYIGAPNGTIDLDQIADSAAGTFDVKTSTDERVTGQFSAASCAPFDFGGTSCI